MTEHETPRRLLSDDELAALSRPPRAEFALALDNSPTAAVEVLRRIDRSYRNFIDGFGTWITVTWAFVAERYGAEGLARVGSADDGYRSALLHGLTDEDVIGRLRTDRADRIARLIDQGDHQAALAHYDDLEAGYRRIHDVERDRVASVLSQVYRAWGADVLMDSIRFAGEQTLLGWMPQDRARPPEVRVRQWAAMQKGNFTDITVEETDDAFVITLHPCGTCGRQVSDGCYGQTMDLAVVTEDHPLTFGQGPVPIYRAHVAVMHHWVPMERIGVPWPVIQCPAGMEAEPCRVVLYKDPDTLPDELPDWSG
ncbi:hypothetical protein [Candidatus Poriferisocius sp.]|uniref:hypothetical protein n=1 Tax=Candidatus Poriferisocius sp. TaxID=3101276 RepID=UPI003B5C02D9